MGEWWKTDPFEWRAITVKGPWDLAIVAPAAREPIIWWSVPVPRGPMPVPPKLCENRVWSTTWRGPLLIHSGKGWDRMGAADPRVFALHRALFPSHSYVNRACWTWAGHVTAVANLVDVHAAHGRCCPDWGSFGPSDHHLVLDDVRALTQPVEANGWQRLWRPDARLVERVRPFIPSRVGASDG
jgi:hypothetical protein